MAPWLAMIADWWLRRKEELLTLALEACPCYVYNEETLNEAFFDLLFIDCLAGLFHPLHLNPHPRVLQKAHEMNLGFRCDSIREYKTLESCIRKLDLHRVLIRGDDEDRASVLRAVEGGAQLLVDGFEGLVAYPAGVRCWTSCLTWK